MLSLIPPENARKPKVLVSGVSTGYKMGTLVKNRLINMLKQTGESWRNLQENTLAQVFVFL